jgi:hypothetical protein
MLARMKDKVGAELAESILNADQLPKRVSSPMRIALLRGVGRHHIAEARNLESLATTREEEVDHWHDGLTTSVGV